VVVPLHQGSCTYLFLTCASVSKCVQAQKAQKATSCTSQVIFLKKIRVSMKKKDTKSVKSGEKLKKQKSQTTTT
jgi:hypothetical protein